MNSIRQSVWSAQLNLKWKRSPDARLKLKGQRQEARGPHTGTGPTQQWSHISPKKVEHLTETAKYFYLFEDKGHNRNVTGAEGEQYECQWIGLDVPRVQGLGLTGRGQSLGNFHMFTWWVLRLSTGWCLPRILSNWGRKAITRDHTHHFSQAGISPLLPL